MRKGVRLSGTFIALLAITGLLLVGIPLARAIDVDVAPNAEQSGLGTSSGFANLAADDGLNWGGTEGVAGTSTTDYVPSSQTIVTGSQVSGTFTADIDSSNNAYIRYQEADTAANPTILTVDSEVLTKANSVSGTEADLDADDGTSRVVSEANQGGAATISFVGSAESSAANGADVTLTLPAMQENDLVVVAYTIGDNDGLDFDMAMVTAGYTEEADLFADDTQDLNLGVFRKFMGPTPDTTAVVDGQGGADAAVAAVAMVFRNVDTATPMDVTTTTATAINTMHPDPPSIDYVTASGVWTVIAGGSGHTLLGAGTYTFPTGYTTDAIDRGQDDTSDTTVGMGYRTTPADPENPGVMTHSGTDSANFAWGAATLALRPGTVLDYELEVRYAFLTETCADTRRLTVNAWRSNGNMENVEVQVEDGSDTGTYVARLTVSQTTDTATQTYDLSGPEWDLGDVQIRMLGTTETGDTLQGQFTMDYVVIACTPPASYKIEVKYDWTGISTTGNSWTLIAECKRVANPEDALIQVGTFPGPSWNTRYVCDSDTDEVFSTYALTAGELNAGAPSVRVLFNDTGDASQSSWDLDHVTVRRAFNFYGLTQYHKWQASVPAADAYQYRVRAFRGDSEDFLAAFWDWEDADWNPTAVTVNTASETLSTYTPATVCGPGADNCERWGANGSLMVRWIGSSETSSDETASVLTADQEVIRRTDNAPTLTSPTHSPASPDDTQTVEFRITYTDTLTCPATSATVSIDGGADQAMSELDPGDTNCADGKVYTLTDGPFSAGAHTYTFTASDGVNDVGTDGPNPFTVTASGGGGGGDTGGGFFNPARTDFTWEVLSTFAGCTLRFRSLATVEPFRIVRTEWSFPDGFKSEGEVVEHTFSEGCVWWYSVWAVRMNVTDSAGGLRTVTRQVVLDRLSLVAMFAAAAAWWYAYPEIRRGALRAQREIERLYRRHLE